jgi:UDP:flavonoid glycosyltransferase YjiC (YdhE family)
MHITLLTAGSRGDTQPYLALGAGLKRAGYDVRVAAAQNFDDFVGGYGLDFAPISVDFSQILSGEGAGPQVGRGPELLKTLRFFSRTLGPLMEQLGRDMLAACQGTDAIFSAVPLLTEDIALALNLPYVQCSLFPFAPTREFSHPFVPQKVPRWLNRFTFTFGEQAAWQMFRRTINRFRQDALDRPPVGMGGRFREIEAARYPTLYGISPQIIPPPRDWTDNIQVTGYWLPDPDPDWHPPQDLLAFLDAGPPPVYVGFGSMPDSDPDRLTKIVVEGLALAGQRGIVLAGWAGMGEIDLPETIYKLDYAPFEWLFPRLAAVVHHGGAGTTGQGARSGVPSLVVPFGGDQFFWGRRISQLGVGPDPLPRKRLTAERLARAIQVATSDESMRERAAALGEKIRAEDGVRQAVSIAQRALGPP